MLYGIPSCITPDLLKALHEMGHGDTLVIGDANFPAASIAGEKHHMNIRCDGHRATELLDAILWLFPLDSFVKQPVTIMDKLEIHKDLECPVWDEFKEIITKHDSRGEAAVGTLDRFAFYDAAKEAYAVVSTSEEAFYSCVIIQKGCVSAGCVPGLNAASGVSADAY